MKRRGASPAASDAAAIRQQCIAHVEGRHGTAADLRLCGTVDEEGILGPDVDLVLVLEDALKQVKLKVCRRDHREPYLAPLLPPCLHVADLLRRHRSPFFTATPLRQQNRLSLWSLRTSACRAGGRAAPSSAQQHT